MHRWKFLLGGIACLVVLAGPVGALTLIMPPSMPERAAASDLVVVGKVTGFGPKLIKADLYKGDTRDLQIADVQVSETLVGKAAKKIQVGYFPPRPVVVQPGRPVRIGGRMPTVQLRQDQEAMLFLTKHPTKDIYLAAHYYDAIPKTNPNFTKDLDAVKQTAKLLAKPMAGLKSTKADERLQTAGLLITRYREQPLNRKTETEEIPAQESKLILTTLAEADWSKRNPQAFRLTPQSLFSRLGVTAADGWTPPKDYKNFQEEAKKWVKANAGKYRIKRFVAAKPTPEPEKK